MARSLVMDADGMIRAGNGTLEAARAAGITEAIVVETDGTQLVVVKRPDWSTEKALAYALSDNRTGELSEWDADALAASLAELGKMDFKFDACMEFDFDGLTEDLIKVREHERRREVVQDKTPDAPKKAITKTGDVWKLGRHRVLCGDVIRDVPKIRPEKGFDLLLTDPPYCSGGFQEAGKKAGSVGTRGSELIHNDQLSTRGYQALMKAALGEVNSGVVYIFTDWRMWVNLYDVVESNGYGVRNMIVWDKGSPGMGRGWRHQHELIMCGSRVSVPFDPKKAQGNVIQAKRTGNVNHATEKPVELIAKILEVTDMAQTVCDPFLGSGTTLIAAEQLERTCYGIEISPAYCDVVVQRWQNLTGEKATRG
jgi:DNA modification methylase